MSVQFYAALRRSAHERPADQPCDPHRQRPGARAPVLWRGARFEIHDLAPEYGPLCYFLCDGGSSIWLIQHDATPPGDRFSEFRIGLDHLAFTASNKAELEALAARLIAAGVPTQGVELFHGRWWYVCFRDPDHIQLEYWLDAPVAGE